MNCKPGKLALVVKTSNPSLGNVGKVCTTIRVVSYDDMLATMAAEVYKQTGITPVFAQKKRDRVVWLTDTGFNHYFIIKRMGITLNPIIKLPYQFDDYMIPLDEDLSEDEVEKSLELEQQ